MNQQQVQQFERIPGTGFMFRTLTKADAKTKTELTAQAKNLPVPTVTVFTGHLTLPGNRELQVRALLETRKRKYHVALHAFPTTSQGEIQEDAWEKVAEFDFPVFGEQNYSDSTFKVDGRTYKVRAIRVVKQDTAYIMLRLPQVVDVKAAARSMM